MISPSSSHVLAICKAERMRHDDPPIPDQIVQFGDGPINQARMTSDAKALAEVLVTTLPGGTWDRLVAEVVMRHASVLHVRRMVNVLQGEANERGH